MIMCRSVDAFIWNRIHDMRIDCHFYSITLMSEYHRGETGEVWSEKQVSEGLPTDGKKGTDKHPGVEGPV